MGFRCVTLELGDWLGIELNWVCSCQRAGEAAAAIWVRKNRRYDVNFSA